VENNLFRKGKKKSTKPTLSEGKRKPFFYCAKGEKGGDNCHPTKEENPKKKDGENHWGEGGEEGRSFMCFPMAEGKREKVTFSQTQEGNCSSKFSAKEEENKYARRGTTTTFWRSTGGKTARSRASKITRKTTKLPGEAGPHSTQEEAGSKFFKRRGSSFSLERGLLYFRRQRGEREGEEPSSCRLRGRGSVTGGGEESSLAFLFEGGEAVSQFLPRHQRKKVEGTAQSLEETRGEEGRGFVLFNVFKGRGERMFLIRVRQKKKR